MNNHKNARLTVFGRQLLVPRILEQGLRVEEAAHAAGVSTRIAYKWLTSYRQEGLMACTIVFSTCILPLMTCVNRGLSNFANSDRPIGTSASLWA